MIFSTQNLLLSYLRFWGGVFDNTGILLMRIAEIITAPKKPKHGPAPKKRTVDSSYTPPKKAKPFNEPKSKHLS